MVGMSRSQLRRIEIGEFSPTVDMLERIADGLDVKAYRLINFDEEFRG
jgi:transcriptional regulator with XRE-family HTH domain